MVKRSYKNNMHDIWRIAKPIMLLVFALTVLWSFTIWSTGYAIDVNKYCVQKNSTFNDEQSDCTNMRHFMIGICQVSCINSKSTVYMPFDSKLGDI
jgi:hypothetical protein